MSLLILQTRILLLNTIVELHPQPGKQQKILVSRSHDKPEYVGRLADNVLYYLFAYRYSNTYAFFDYSPVTWRLQVTDRHDAGARLYPRCG